MRLHSLKRISKLTLPAAVLAVLGVTLGKPIGGSANASAVALPFHAVLEAQASPVPIGPCTLANHEIGSGHALHLGTVTWFSDETAQFDSCSPSGPTSPAITVSGKFKLVAANGDEIDGKYITHGTLDSVNGVSVSGGYTFVSGTGRFSNVTGGGTIAAQGASSPPFDSVGTLDGTISYSGK